MKNKIYYLATLFVAILSGCSKHDADIDQQVEEIYNRMTPGERLVQLQGIYFDQFFDENNQLIEAKCKELIPNGIGHFSQFAMSMQKSPDELRDMLAQIQKWIINNTPNGIPALFHEEVLSGVNAREATIYPQQIGLACSFNSELAEKKTYETASVLRKMGGFMALSPMVDVVRNPSFNRLEESYGEDAYLSAVMGVAFVKGLQHDNLKKGVAACSKHFLGYGGGGDADKKELMEEILLPHETIIRLAGSQVLMTGYHSVDGIHCVANAQIQKDILRDYLHYDGITVSDYSSIDQINDSLSDMQRGAAALNAGNDVDFPKGDSYKLLPEAIKQGLTTEEAVEKAVKNVLRLKVKLGLFDDNVKFYAKGHIVADTKESRHTAYELATQSVVLLKNDGTLPLKNCDNKTNSQTSKLKIALVGPNANSMWAMCGDYSYPAMRYFWKKSQEDGLHPMVVGLKQGMENFLPKNAVLSYSRGCDWTEEVETMVDQSGDPRVAYLLDIQNRMMDSGEKADWQDAITKASQSDVVIAAVGENAILCGENRDRQHMRLPGRQEEFVEALIATGKPVVLVVFGGRAQILSNIADRCAAIIQAWYPGEEGGNALADIIYGNVSPSGKLSVSYPKEEIHEPICYNYSQTDDSRIAWPFGYGLSYTTFEYSNLVADKEVATSGEAVKLSFDIKNTGNMKADEVVQVYISPVNGKTRNYRPIQLQGFARVSLRPSEKKTVRITMHPEQFGYFANNEWNIAPERFIIKVGASSRDIKLQQEVVLTGELVTKPLRETYFSIAK